MDLLKKFRLIKTYGYQFKIMDHSPDTVRENNGYPRHRQTATIYIDHWFFEWAGSKEAVQVARGQFDVSSWDDVEYIGVVEV